MEQIYELMHLDDVAGKITIDTDFLSPRAFEVVNPELVPLRANKSITDFRLWFENRAIPKTRNNLKDYLEKQGMISPKEYLIKNLALSLSDCYWIRPLNSHISWNNVNLYDTDFGIIETKEENKSSFTPDASTGGDLPKWWIIKGRDRFLVKASIGGTYQQSFNEIFASSIHRNQKFKNAVNYEQVKIHEKGIGCIVKAFTSKELEFIPAWDVMNSINYPKSLKQSKAGFINFLEIQGMSRKEVTSFLDYMALTDFLIGNEDRHFNNFGILRNTKTLKFVSMAPLFDFGNSMGFGNYEIQNKSLLFKKIKGFNSSNKSTLSNVTDMSLVDISKLPNEKTIVTLYQDSRMSDKDIKDMGVLFEERKEILQGLQNGMTFYDLTAKYR